MKSRNKQLLNEERKLRNVSDYIFDCINRLIDHSELLLFITKYQNDFIDVQSKNILTIIISIYDVYSRDSIIILGNMFDDKQQTSSLFTLVNHIEDDKIKNKLFDRLKSIKKDINLIIRARGNQVAHFNTNLNIYENGYTHLNAIFQMNPQYLKKMTKRIEKTYWEIREALGIEGTFIFHKGESLVESFKKLTGKKIHKKIIFGLGHSPLNPLCPSPKLKKEIYD